MATEATQLVAPTLIRAKKAVVGNTGNARNSAALLGTGLTERCALFFFLRTTLVL
jgi:hypothetical protein